MSKRTTVFSDVKFKDGKVYPLNQFIDMTLGDLTLGIIHEEVSDYLKNHVYEECKLKITVEYDGVNVHVVKTEHM